MYLIVSFFSALRIRNPLITEHFRMSPNRFSKISPRRKCFLQVISSVFAGIKSVRLNLVRKWFFDLLTGLKEIHSSTEYHKPLIHGRIR